MRNSTRRKRQARKNPAPTLPKCEVIVRKDAGQEGVQCPNDAKYVIQITDPDDPTHLGVIGVVVLCERHAEKFDQGKTYLTKDKDGNYSLSQAILSTSPSPPTGNKKPPE